MLRENCEIVMKIDPRGNRHRHNHRVRDGFYQSKTWRSTRDAFMAVNKRCIECGEKSQVCDHKIRIKDGGDPVNWNNLQPLCHKCHNKKDNNAGRAWSK